MDGNVKMPLWQSHTTASMAPISKFFQRGFAAPFIHMITTTNSLVFQNR